MSPSNANGDALNAASFKNAKVVYTAPAHSERYPGDYTWDAINMDFIIRVLNKSILSPAFAFWAPLMTLAQGHSWTHIETQTALYYFAMTFVLWLVPWSSRVWTNQHYKHGIRRMLVGDKVDWGSQVVVITGGANGLGRLLAQTLAIRNVPVAVLDVQDTGDWGRGEGLFVKCDVSDRAQVASAAARIREELGEPTILVNNCGIFKDRGILESSAEEIERTLQVNTLSQFWTIREFLPSMIKRKAGHVVTISSVMSGFAPSGASSYASSKAAVTSLHESLRTELDHVYNAPNVRTTLFLPGHLPTSLFAQMRTSPLAQFLFPTVDLHDAVKTLINALDAHESRVVCMPWYANWVWAMRGVPSWLRDASFWLAGANDALGSYGSDESKKAK